MTLRELFAAMVYSGEPASGATNLRAVSLALQELFLQIEGL